MLYILKYDLDFILHLFSCKQGILFYKYFKWLFFGYFLFLYIKCVHLNKYDFKLHYLILKYFCIITISKTYLFYVIYSQNYINLTIYLPIYIYKGINRYNVHILYI